LIIYFGVVMSEKSLYAHCTSARNTTERTHLSSNIGSSALQTLDTKHRAFLVSQLSSLPHYRPAHHGLATVALPAVYGAPPLAYKQSVAAMQPGPPSRCATSVSSFPVDVGDPGRSPRLGRSSVSLRAAQAAGPPRRAGPPPAKTLLRISPQLLALGGVDLAKESAQAIESLAASGPT
jgi:hypothetical protein